MADGWICLHRKISEDDIWFLEKFTKAQAWIDLILNANHKDNIIDIRGNLITIKRGQIGWSELTMSDRWKWSRNKVRGFLSFLEKDGKTIQQKLFKITTITTILKYEQYQTIQQKDNRKTTDDTTEGTQTTMLNNENNLLGQCKIQMPIPNNYSIQPEHIKYASTKNIPENIARSEFESFVSHHSSKGTKFKNWYAAYQKWIQNGIKFKSIFPEKQKKTNKELLK